MTPSRESGVNSRRAKSESSSGVRLNVGRSEPPRLACGNTLVNERSAPAAKNGLTPRLAASSNCAAMFDTASELGVSE
jgi:hypothetical protein